MTMTYKATSSCQSLRYLRYFCIFNNEQWIRYVFVADLPHKYLEINLQLTLEQHRTELCGSVST